MAKLKKLAKSTAIRSRRALRSFDRAVQKTLLWPLQRVWKIKRLRRTILPIARFVRGHHRVTAGGLAILIVASALIPAATSMLTTGRYQLSSEVAQLVGAANENITSKIDYNPELMAYEFNADAKKSTESGAIAAQLATQTGGGDKDAEQQYSVDVSRNLKDGVTYHENAMGLSFTLTPQFAAMNGEKVEGGRLLYPLADGLGGQLVYTAQSKGLKEDVVLHKKPAQDQVVLRYNIELPKSLEIKLLDSGALGIYSADPALYGNIQYGGSDDEELMNKVRENGEKTHLAFTVPAPYVVGLDEEGQQERMSMNSRFVLSNDKKVLSVITEGFDQTTDANYPLSIDPSVTVTSTTDFNDGGNDEDNNVTFGTDQISRDQLTGGALNNWSTTGTPLLDGGGEARAVVYNGQIYVAKYNNNGGASLVIYTTNINSNGTLNASWALWSGTQPVLDHGARAEFLQYGGYLYLIGGQGASTTVEYSKIRTSDGGFDPWQQANSLQTGRANFGATIYNGRIYVAGSNVSSETSSVEYASINADGSLTAWQTTTSLPTVRAFNSMTAQNGYVYVLGGSNAGAQVNNLRARINDDGTLAAWQVMSGPHYAETGIAQANGYVYNVGGGEIGTASGLGQVSYGQITADGNINPWRATTAHGTSNLIKAAAVVAHNGYLYRIGGNVDTVGMSTAVQYAPIKSAGDVDRWTTTSATMGTRNNAASVVYNGYLYLLTGQSGSTGTALSTTTRVPLNADGSWGTAIPSTSTATGSLVTATRSLAAFAYNGYMYAIGGSNAAGTTYLTTVQRTPIASDGSLGTWSTTSQTQLASGRWGHKATFYNGRVYVTGGRLAASSFSSATLYAAIDASGNIGAWTTSGSTFTTARTQHETVQYGGYLYVMGGWNGTTVYSDVQYAKINDNGSLGTWATTEALFGGAGGAIYSFGSFAANGYMYAMGGAKSSGVSNITAKAQVNPNGSLEVWQQVSDSGGASVDRSYQTTSYAYGYVYVHSGIPNSGGTGVNTMTWGRVGNGGTGAISAQTTAASASASQYACSFVYQDTLYQLGGTGMSSLTFNEDGSTSTWFYRGSLPESRRGAGCGVDGNRVYLVGGYTTGGTLLSSVIYATINEDASVSAWQTATSLSTATQHGSSFVRGGYLYFMGGSTGSAVNTTRYAPINSDGSLGSWSATATLYQGVAGAASAVVGPYVYLVGGLNAAGDEVDTAQYALINGDGTLGTWARTLALPDVRGYASTTASNGYLYVLGGQDSAAAATATVYYAPINTNGSLGSWQSTAALPEASVGHQSLFYRGRLYTTGGSTPFYQKVFYTTGIDMQARQASYTKMIHTGYFGAVTGIDYTGTLAAGAEVNMQYRVASANAQFGRTYEGWDVTDEGNLASLCSTADGAARAGQYIFVTVTIDDSMVTRYSDAESNDASIVGSFTVDYAAPVRAPSELRMRGGKWFSETALQPLDTCAPLVSALPPAGRGRA
jgi:N-acetylneuraminic acid mutarotase